MNLSVFNIATFTIALFMALLAVYIFIYKKINKEERIKLVKKIVVFTVTITFGLYLATIVIESVINRNDHKSTEKPANKNETSTKKDPSEQFSLSKDSPIKLNHFEIQQIRREIINFLHEGYIDEAINHLKYLSSPLEKDEECDHIFNYCIKNGKLKKAEEVLPFFQNPIKLKEAKKKLALEWKKIEIR